MRIPDFAFDDGVSSLFRDIQYVQAGSSGSTAMFPKYLIMHYTAGRGFDSTVERFRDASNQVSAHLVVGRKGEVVQMVHFDRPAWHAGPTAHWHEGNMTLEHMNFHSIGIEFDNYGPLHKAGSKFQTWFGRNVSSSEVAEVDVNMAGAYNVPYWHSFSEVQIAIAEKVSKVLTQKFGLLGILGHSDVCPGRKQDPGPVFPMKHLRAILSGRSDKEGLASAATLFAP